MTKMSKNGHHHESSHRLRTVVVAADQGAGAVLVTVTVALVLGAELDIIPGAAVVTAPAGHRQRVQGGLKHHHRLHIVKNKGYREYTYVQATLIEK